ncbi:hypothetical protein JNJ66_01625 [Candidatus Saccharibacteria bacterium]|nr:hypothetical protein [Candidatus Saccharibacteria bacterium]
MTVKTINSEQVWQSPDGQKTIWKVTLEAGGQQYELKTYSRAISEIGYEGSVESYTNERGDRFVRQIPKKPAESTAVNRDSSIRAQWAIGQAIALASATMDKKAITMPVIETYAKQLFTTVSRVMGESVTPAMMQNAETVIRGYTQPQRI